MPNPDARISTHPGSELRLSRLGIFRLKHAAIRRDEAIRDAEKRYTREVEAILARAPAPPAIAAINNQVRWPWHVDILALSRLVHRRPSQEPQT